ncbi:MAG: anthranilate phosphoribosyltransferase [Selenomonadales bacterium]|nr:anthranilate phosphoribosyltransferase [Selenomonadales bacterium]
MLQASIAKLVIRENLSQAEALADMREIMSGKAEPAAVASFLTALSMKGETVDEITACAQGMTEAATQIHPDGDILEIVGTGGDKAGTFNISTTSMFVIAASGAHVAKHGNRGVSSKSGAADVLEHLGVKIDNPPALTEQMENDIGIAFLFAPVYHAAMRYVAPVRKTLGIRTVFNILGPLTNPANPRLALIGVYSKELVRPIAEVLRKRGLKRALVVYGDDGLDEISASSTTTVAELRDGALREYTLDPRTYGLPLARKEELVGGDLAENARITRAILTGEERGAKRTAVLLNAGAGLYLAGKADDLAAGIRQAGELVDTGKALAKLEEMVAYSRHGGLLH